MTSSEFAFGRTQTPMNTAVSPRSGPPCCSPRRPHDVGDLAESDDVAFLLPDDELSEIFGRVQVGVGDEVHLDHEPLVRPSAER